LTTVFEKLKKVIEKFIFYISSGLVLCFSKESQRIENICYKKSKFVVR
jgi:hypothetical protein